MKMLNQMQRNLTPESTISIDVLFLSELAQNVMAAVHQMH